MTVDPGASGAPMSDRMQTLLARAVEDQLSEQRQLAGALTDLRGQLARIAEQMEALRGGGEDAAPAEALAGVSAEVREAARLLAERLDGVGRLVQQRGVDLSEVKASINELQLAVRAHTEALAGVSGGLSAVPAFGERIASLQDTLAGVSERLAGLDEMPATIAGVQQRIESVGQELRDTRAAFTGIASRMADLPARADLDGAIARLNEPLAAAVDRLGALERALPDLGERLSALAAAPAPSASSEHTQQSLEELRGELARFAAAVTDDAARTDERLVAIREEMAELTTRVPEPGEEPAAEDGDLEVEDDPALAELADLRAALTGPGGVAEKLDALARTDLDSRVAAAVSEAVGAAESRLAAHVDAAVLALAEALLRPRAARSRPVPAAVVSSAVESAPPPVAADPDEAEEDTALDEAGPNEAGPTEAGLNEAGPPASPGWQTPPGPPPSTAASGDAETAADAADADQADDAADGTRRRRPWWRPSD